jgi:ABC-type bacteriocin/lantibiotic exporter with double-glycine peptidase domain
LAGWLQTKRSQSQRISKQVSAGFIPFILLLCVGAPYLKQIFLLPDWNGFSDRWSEGVCLQSSESSCGPASTATLLKLAGKPVTEKEIAQESFTSRRGTENWYLIRTLRHHGLNVHYSIGKQNQTSFSFPSIVGVRLGGKSGAGHFITILGKSGNRYVVGDPLSGREELDETQLQDRYYFTGFSIVTASN